MCRDKARGHVDMSIAQDAGSSMAWRFVIAVEELATLDQKLLALLVVLGEGAGDFLGQAIAILLQS